MAQQPLCSFPECGRKHKAKGLCAPHYRQLRMGEAVRPVRKVTRSTSERGGWGDWYVDTNGYRASRKWVSGKHIYKYEHREIFELELGRPLLRTENIHHKNGDRADNRRENLELWVKMQPSGQRPEDLLSYAHEIIRLYGHLEVR